MSLLSTSFFFFLLITLIIYYLLPKQKIYILLIASLFFYFAVSPAGLPQMLGLTAYILAVTYLGAIWIEKSTGKMKTIATSLSVISLVAVLVSLKYLYNLSALFVSIFHLNSDISFLKFLPYIGVSYFILSAIGYLLDVSWGTYPAERNLAKVGLFVYYFPQIISGPVTRFQNMKEQFDSPTSFDSDNVVNGINRMIWGYFKKLVISERFAMIVTTVYSNYQSYGALDIVIATLCYAVQLYTDFSGCMDIIMGASETFGIKLPENFNAPFASKSVQEFWQRWHITLGLWFKDYVMYPVQKTPFLISLGKKTKSLFGKNIGRKIPFYCAMTVLWALIGIWHGGTSYYIIASAAIPFFFLFVRDIFSPLFDWFNKKLSINSENHYWKAFQMTRTLLLICVCWLFVCAGSTGGALNVIKHMFSNPLIVNIKNLWVTVGRIGFFAISGLGMLLIIIEHYLITNNNSIITFLNKRNFFFKWLLIYIEIGIIFVFGLVGQSEFIYFQF